MSYKPIKIPKSTPEKINEYTPPNLGGGLNLRDLPQKLLSNQSPDLLNVWYQNKTLSKRMGQEVRFILGSDPIYAMCDGLDGTTVIIHIGTNIIEVNKSQL